MPWSFAFSPWSGRIDTDPERPDSVAKSALRWHQRAEWFGERYRVLCNPTPDVFDPAISSAWVLDLLRAIYWTPRIQWFLISERPADLRNALERAAPLIDPASEEQLLSWLQGWHSGHRCPANVCLGVRANDHHSARAWVPVLAEQPTQRRLLWLSPLRDRVTLKNIVGADRLHWVVLCGDSGANARPLHPAWVRDVRDTCGQLGVPFYFESWGDWVPRQERLPNGITCEQADPRLIRWTCQTLSSDNLSGRDLRHATGERVHMQRVGKESSGQWLDHALWQQELHPHDHAGEQGAAG